MGGFFGGFGGAAGQFGEARRNEMFQHSENAMRLAQLRQSELAQAVQQAADQYAGPEGERLRDLQMQIHTLDPGSPTHAQDIAKLTQQYVQHKQRAQQALEQKAAQDAQTIKPVASPPPASAQNSNPFAGMIAGAPAQAAAPPAAQPDTNPLTSPIPSMRPDVFMNPSKVLAPGQGGAQPVGGPFSGNPAVEPGPVPAPVPPALIPPVGNAHSDMLSAASPLDLQRSFDAFNSTGYIDPVTRAMIPGQAALATGVQKLPLVQSILDQMGPMTDANGLPDMSKLMRAEAQLSALGVQSANMAPLLLQMLQPQSEPGMTTVASLEATHPGFLASQGYDIASLDPQTPLRVQVNKFTRAPVSAQIQSVPTSTKQFAEGTFNFNPRTGRYEPVPGLTPIGMVPHEGFMSIQQADGSISLVPVETGKKQIAAGRAFPTPNSVANAQPDVQAAIAQAQHSNVPPVANPAASQPVPSITPKPSGAGTTGRVGAGIKVGDRNMPPEEKVKNEQQAELYNTSIGNIASLKSELPILANMISAGKIAMQASPDAGWAHALVNRLMPLSPEEAAAAAHWQQMNDEIFELRIPLGAAAGRNAAMMATIQANRGTLAQNPQVLAHMLDNVGAEFRNLRKPLVEAGGKYGFNVEPELTHARDVIPTVTGLTATHKLNGRGIALDPKSNQWVFVDDGKPAK